MVEKTNVYFLSEITKNFGNGDCILLENIDIKSFIDKLFYLIIYLNI